MGIGLTNRLRTERKKDAIGTEQITGRENCRACALSQNFITCSYGKDRRSLYAITLTIKQSARLARIKIDTERRESPEGEKYEWISVIVLIGSCGTCVRVSFVWTLACKEVGIDPDAKTPAYTHEDGQDYVPSSSLRYFPISFLPSREQDL